MRNLNELAIDKGVVHILNNQRGELTLTDFEFELKERIQELIKAHIKNSINEEGTRIAKFDNQINVVRDLCQKIIENEQNLVPLSKEIAQYLFDSMKHHKISPANFIVCIYRANNQKYIALLKMDFNDIVQTKIEYIQDKVKIGMDISGTGIPTEKQKLQKCVFFRRYDPNNDYDIILLDKQALKSKTDKEVADFFSINFLHCRLAKTNRDNTRLFKRLTEKFIMDNITDEEKTHDLRTYVINALKTQDSINVSEFAENAFGFSEEIKVKYQAFISETIGDNSFDIDKGWVKEKLRKRKIKTNTGIEINVEIETSEDSTKFEIKRYEGKSEVDILIKNVTYTEKTV